jgi:hypothetical protein
VPGAPPRVAQHHFDHRRRFMSDAKHHSHAHAHAVEDYAARRHPEFVVLELGEDLGALIVHTDSAMHGVEVEISPDGDPGPRSHKQVLERSIGGHAAFTAVFDGLGAGTYTLWAHGKARARGVVIEGGVIAELDWRSLGALV